MEFLRLYDYDLMLTDLALPDMPGHELIRRARAAGLAVPAIVMATSADPATHALALDRGADDIVIAPCDPNEMLARVRAVVRRSQGHARSELRCGPLSIDLAKHEARLHGAKLSLSRREFGVIELLTLKQGVILNRDAFINHLYSGTEEPMDKTIDVAICRLRKKLAAAGAPRLIRTLWGLGFMLTEPDPPAPLGQFRVRVRIKAPSITPRAPERQRTVFTPAAAVSILSRERAVLHNEDEK